MDGSGNEYGNERKKDEARHGGNSDGGECNDKCSYLSGGNEGKWRNGQKFSTIMVLEVFSMIRPMTPAADSTPASTNGAPADLADRFRSLAEQWKSAVALESSTSAMISHAAYRAIIAIGPPV